MSYYELRDRKIRKSSTALRPGNLRSSGISTSGGRKRSASAANLMGSTQNDKMLLSRASQSLNQENKHAAIDVAHASGSGFQLSSSPPDCVSICREIEKDEELARKLQASPDPVLQVRLFEEDERYAYMLQNSFNPVDVARQIEADEAYARSLQHSEVGSQPDYRHEQENREADEQENYETDTSGELTDLTNDEPSNLTNDETTDEAVQFGGTDDDEEDITDYEEDDLEASLDLMNGTRPLSVSEISRLPVRAYEASSSSCSSDCIKECHICMSDYQSGDQLRILPCFHEFHVACIDLWLNRNNTCPICRVHITLEDYNISS